MIRALLSGERTPRNRSELSGCGIGYLREYAQVAGWGREDLARYLRECRTVAREVGASGDAEGLARYLRGRRAGRGMMATPRAAKVAAFAQLVGRGMV